MSEVRVVTTDVMEPETIDRSRRSALRQVDETCPDDQWDRFVNGRPGADVLQTSQWARVKSASADCERVVLRDAARTIVAGAQMLVRRVGLARVGYVPFGPIATTSDDATLVVEGLESLARRLGLAALLIHPARSGRGQTEGVASLLANRGFRTARTDVAASATVDLELVGSIEEMRRGYNKSRRKNLKKARAAGVKVYRAGAEGLELFHTLHVGSARRNGFAPMSLDYIERQGAELGVGDGLQIAVAELDGAPVAAGLFTTFNGRIDFKMTGWDPTPRSSQACVNDAIQDFMIEWALDAGFDVFDLGGLPRAHAELLLDPDADHTLVAGTGTTFKIAWGGQVRVDASTHEKVLRPIGRITYELPSRLLADQGLGGRIVNWLRRS